jgi:NAD(P)-dependent dehydrogenase (short-subunit alcohol dehydrogenase family)
VAQAVGEHQNLLVARLDVTDAQCAEQAVAAAVERFDRIDVLVNNAGNSFGGFFEELSPQPLARALVELAGSDEPPLRWVAGEDPVEGVEQKARLLLAQVDAHGELTTSLAYDHARAAA